MRRSVICFSLLLFNHSILAKNWEIRPSIGFKEIYSDNINLTDTAKKNAFVTELSPGISVNRASSNSDFNLHYRMQNLYNAGGNSDIDINHQLQMNALYQAVLNRLYLESSSSISQQNISNRQTRRDNISGNGNRATVTTFNISPYWTPHFNNFADGEFRVTYNRVNSDNKDKSNLSDTNTLSQNIKLTSGYGFSGVKWSILFNNSKTRNSDSEDIKLQNSEITMRYLIAHEFSAFMQGGHSNNSFSSNSSNNKNGVYYTFGGEWKPSLRFRLEAGAGNNSFVTVEVSPFNRLHWTLTYLNKSIGLNTGNNWNTTLDYRTRRSTWKLGYKEETVTVQQRLLNQDILRVTDDFTDKENQSSQFNTRLPSLTDEVFITKNVDISASYRSGKSDITVNAFKYFRTFEQSGNEEELTGINFNWRWALARRTSALVRSGWQKTESDGTNVFSDDRIDFSVGIERNIQAHLNGKLEYSYTDQSSDDNLNTYIENRVTATLSLQY